jgi:hypothetical protein
LRVRYSSISEWRGIVDVALVATLYQTLWRAPSRRRRQPGEVR